MRTHRVYRLYDADDHLLYVGVTSNTMQARLGAHRRDKSWFAEVERHEVDRSMPEDDAFLEEQRQIVRLHPRYNGYPGKVRMIHATAPEGFPAKLREARLDAELSEAELAERAGLSLHSIRRWESGQARPESIYALRLGEALGLGLAFITAICSDIESDSQRAA
jgi:DNA-binding XRE family transcriptional regulator